MIAVTHDGNLNIPLGERESSSKGRSVETTGLEPAYFALDVVVWWRLADLNRRVSH